MASQAGRNRYANPSTAFPCLTTPEGAKSVAPKRSVQKLRTLGSKTIPVVQESIHLAKCQQTAMLMFELVMLKKMQTMLTNQEAGCSKNYDSKRDH
ncbi:hypothetical protein OGAPHI_002467 [Ogataea philodendri]|uniref:Uncharacterized protein n=1 Tax=Ogataea philodendri TaxID=1378263 RepID=A0A9P8PAQ6_9ASCO|nr:uncharacterized protein OGAPHI_002467 [Ogataea philodendri]KAH3668713.1 hypothetical protein OGAPHI_002467 [Ogataea philodendri]